jgi:tetratricopeptide (TPR) repeat protein
MNRLVVIAAAIGLAHSVHAQSPADRIAAGDAEYAAFRPADALKHYEAALAADSTNAEALWKASRSAVDLGEQETNKNAQARHYDAGLTYARRAVKLLPDDPETNFSVARALGRKALSVGVRDRVKFAVDIREYAMRALATDPKHPGALHVVGMWNAEVMRLNGMERFFAKNFLGGKVFGEASWDKAQTYLEQAVANDPDRIVHKLDLGEIYLDRGNTAKAREQFKLVVSGIRKDANDPQYKQQAERALAKLGGD